MLYISELDPTVQVIQNDCFPSKYDGQGCVQKCKVIVKVFCPGSLYLMTSANGSKDLEQNPRE